MQTIARLQQHPAVEKVVPVNDDTSEGHGSNVASIIGARGNNGTDMSGIAWNTSLMILKVGDSSNGVTSQNAADAVNYTCQAADRPAAINMSFGGFGLVPYPPGCVGEGCDYYRYDPELESALEQARNNNVVVVTSAGNFNQTNNDGTYTTNPASIPTDNNIAVLATDDSDFLTSYSNFGPNTVDIGAPGGVIGNGILGLAEDPSSWTRLAGTSQAAPHVTGAIALVKSLYPWEPYSGLRDRVLMGTDRTGTLDGKCRTNGKLDIYKALQKRSMFRNLSTRARVKGGDRVMIGGFYIGGGAGAPTLKVAVRGLDPSLAQQGIANPLNNPTIHIDGPGISDTNNDWQQDPRAAELASVGLAPSDVREAGMVRDLAPGAYTVTVSAEDGQYGVGFA